MGRGWRGIGSRRAGPTQIGRALSPVLALALALVCGVSGCTSADAPEPASAELTVAVLDAGAPARHVTGRDIETTGPGHPAGTVLSEHGGRLRSTTGPDGRKAMRFPAYAAVEEAPTAILAVSSTEPRWLDPGERPFRFGADVSIDATTSGTVHDNGDNVLQRGLFVDPVQFKLQADHHRPSCLVRGAKGSTIAESRVTLQPDTWYRLTCAREPGTLEITVSRLVDGRPVDTDSVRVAADVGAVDFPARTPLTVGGKIAADGSPAHATDQFNGSIGRVFVDVDGQAQDS